MSNETKTLSEKQFQQDFVEKLQQYNWEAPDELNGNLHKGLAVSDLIDNWRKELNRLNADVLEGVELTDDEFARVMSQVNRIANSYEAAKVLCCEGNRGKIPGIARDSHPKVTRDSVTLTIFTRANVGGGDTHYQIAREVTTDDGKSRFDLVLLINGLPLINIEQKRMTKDIMDAYHQFKRYYEAGCYSYNFMAFSQMMVITSNVDTLYFATPKNLESFNPSFLFHWAYSDRGPDKEKYGKPMTYWEDIVAEFLMIPMAHQMVGDYLVIDEAKEEDNRKIMLLRPYQVYALQAISFAAFGGGDGADPHGGFVWHTTGSGKTITSFKAALFLATRAHAHKVVFLVDRKELDSRTSANFKAYASIGASIPVDETNTTSRLGQLLSQSSPGIIVTTTHKLNALVKEKIENHDDRLGEKKLFFIIDEAHRTTMGEMMKTITDYFKKNSLFFGFTGTPLFSENSAKGMVNKKNELIDTTEKLFGKLLHQYTIDEAIRDNNVLGFHIDYLNTGEFRNYDDLKDQIIEQMMEENPKGNRNEIERRVANWSELEVELEAKERKLLIYQDEVHIPAVVTRILDNWDSQSQGNYFNAILTVALKERVKAYYKEFKKQLAERNQQLNVALTFSFSGENSEEFLEEKEWMQTVFTDYAAFTNIEFKAGDSRHGEGAYFEDLIERATKGGSGINPRYIDLIIVADQLLTGYDSKRLNTLYVDRQLELQGLIQAYSRTNRIFGAGKEFGTIINFQYPAITAHAVERALSLYGGGGKSEEVIKPKYDEAVAAFKDRVRSMRETLRDPRQYLVELDTEEAKKTFKTAFKVANKQLRFIQQYYEYTWDDEKFGITEELWSYYLGVYRNLRTKEEDEDDLPLQPLVGKTKIVNSQRITADEILKLIGNKATKEGSTMVLNGESLRIILEKIQELNDLGYDQQAQLLNQFVKEVEAGHIPSTNDVDGAFMAWKEAQLDAEIQEFALSRGADFEIIKKAYRKYANQVGNDDDIPDRQEITNSISSRNAREPLAGHPVKHKKLTMDELTTLMYEWKKKYGKI